MTSEVTAFHTFERVFRINSLESIVANITYIPRPQYLFTTLLFTNSDVDPKYPPFTYPTITISPSYFSSLFAFNGHSTGH